MPVAPIVGGRASGVPERVVSRPGAFFGRMEAPAEGFARACGIAGSVGRAAPISPGRKAPVAWMVFSRTADGGAEGREASPLPTAGALGGARENSPVAF